MAFNALGLKDELVRGLTATGYTTPTPIQAQAIPIAITGADLIGCAQTGTGKTAAFVLPLLNRLSDHPVEGHHKRVVRALILTPTRELAVQVEDFIKTYGKFLKVKSLCVYGGVSISAQLDTLRRGVDIVIATPGRLLDHIDRRSIDLKHIEFLVLDEADRMFDMGFINDVRAIIDVTPQNRQTLLFSATMTSEVRKLAGSIMKDPQLVDIGGRRDPAASVTQHVYRVPKAHKPELLMHILNTAEMDNVLVFSRTKHGADKITTKLERAGVKAVAIHSNRTQSQRQRALDGFKRGQYKVLVATDIAARGIDVEGISHVINFDTPTHPEDYIHRIGRTGRAEATGDALTFVSSEEEDHMRDIERYMGKRLERKKYEGFTWVAPEEAKQAPRSATEPRPSAEPRPFSDPRARQSAPPRSREHEEDMDRQPESNNTPALERPQQGRGRGSRPQGTNAGRPATRGRRSDGPSSGGRRESGQGFGGPRGPRREGAPTYGESRGPRREGAPGAGGPRGPRREGAGSAGPGGFRRSGPGSDRPAGRSGRPQGPGDSRRGPGGPAAPRGRSGDRRRPEPTRDAGQGQESSSLRFYASKGKPVRKDVSVSKFTGALFNNDDAGFVHPLSAAAKKNKTFSWNPFKRKK